MKTYTFDEQDSGKFTFTPSTKLTPEVLLAISHSFDLTFFKVTNLSNYSLSELIITSEYHNGILNIGTLQRALYNQYSYFTGDYYFEYEYHCSTREGDITESTTYRDDVERDDLKNRRGFYGWSEYKYDKNLNLIEYSERAFTQQYPNGHSSKYKFDDNGNFTGYIDDTWTEVTFKPTNDKNTLCSVYDDGKLVLEIKLRNPK